MYCQSQTIWLKVMHVGYEEHLIAKSSRDLTTSQTPFVALRLVTLPMGWMGFVLIFHHNVTYMLQQEMSYIDDAPVKVPVSRYLLGDGSYVTLPDNPDIRKFVWELFQNMDRIVQHMKYCSGTFSGKKLLLCVEKFCVVGHCCTSEGKIVD